MLSLYTGSRSVRNRNGCRWVWAYSNSGEARELPGPVGCATEISCGKTWLSHASTISCVICKALEELLTGRKSTINFFDKKMYHPYDLNTEVGGSNAMRQLYRRLRLRQWWSEGQIPFFDWFRWSRERIDTFNSSHCSTSKRAYLAITIFVGLSRLLPLFRQLSSQHFGGWLLQPEMACFADFVKILSSTFPVVHMPCGNSFGHLDDGEECLQRIERIVFEWCRFLLWRHILEKLQCVLYKRTHDQKLSLHIFLYWQRVWLLERIAEEQPSRPLRKFQRWLQMRCQLLCVPRCLLWVLRCLFWCA